MLQIFVDDFFSVRLFEFSFLDWKSRIRSQQISDKSRTCLEEKEVYKTVCVCVCVCERERERERESLLLEMIGNNLFIQQLTEIFFLRIYFSIKIFDAFFVSKFFFNVAKNRFKYEADIIHEWENSTSKISLRLCTIKVRL